VGIAVPTTISESASLLHVRAEATVAAGDRTMSTQPDGRERT